MTRARCGRYSTARSLSTRRSMRWHMWIRDARRARLSSPCRSQGIWSRLATTMPTNPETLTRTLSDRYRIDREIARGGMATVYLADDLKHGRQVAIKVLRAELAASVGQERFLREIEIASRLTHPHILPLYDSGTADGQLFYVMPFVAGGSLRTWLEREKQLSIEDALRVTREGASALGHAPRAGLG